MRIRLRAALVAFAALLQAAAAGSARAAPPGPPVPMTLERAIEQGARRGPATLEAVRNREAASDFARHPGSSLPSVPQATVLAGARDPYNLPTGPEVVLTVQQEVSLRGLGSARRRAADWAARAATSDVDRARLEGAAAAALAWIDLLEAQELRRVREASTRDADRLVAIAEIRVTSGVATAVERSLAEAERGASELAVLDAEGRATEARIALAHATASPLDQSLVADGRLDEAASIPSGDALAHVSQHPALRAAEERARQASAESAVLRAASGPTFSFGVSLWREGSGDRAAGAVVSVPLTLFDPARYDAARQGTIAAIASSHAERLGRELEREAHLAVHDREHTREVRAKLGESVVRPLRSALVTATTAYASGTTDLGVVLLARRSALSAEERLVMATADVRRADIRVSALSGTLTRGVSR